MRQSRTERITRTGSGLSAPNRFGSMYTACTICACNYLAYARVLAESFYLHHPDGTFVVLVIDDEHRRLAPDGSRIEWRRLSDIGLDEAEMRRLAGIYDVRELSTAVKRLLLRHPL